MNLGQNLGKFPGFVAIHPHARRKLKSVAYA